jgi:cell division protease FtsH
MSRNMSFTLVYLLIAFLVLFAFQTLVGRPGVEEIPYSKFRQYLEQGRIITCEIGSTSIRGIIRRGGDSGGGYRMLPVNGGLIEGKHFRTVRVEDPDLVKLLAEKGVEFNGRIESYWLRDLLVFWLAPLALLGLFWAVIQRRMRTGGGLMAIGKSKAKVYVDDKPKTNFSDVAGIDEVVEEVKEIVEFLREPERFRSLGGKIPKGVLLVGPPGTGKTLLAKAIAGEAKVPFFSLSGSDFVEMFVGVGAARVRDLFEQAKAMQPCIVFIDELDALGKSRGLNPIGGHDEREQTLNQLLVEMDGFEPNADVIIIAATNRPEILDMALLRPGRFDRRVVVDRPDIDGREAILEVHARNIKLAPDVDLRVIAGRTPGFVGADLANIINEAALLAARAGKKAVTMSDLEEAIDRVVAGLERKSRVLSKKEKEIVAYHEAGHAIVAASVEHVDPLHRVSVIPRGVAALGYTLQLPTEDRYLMTRSELFDRMKVLLGGRVAEELTFAEISTGAQNDMERATEIARSMVVEYGMSEKLGPVSYRRRTASYLGMEYGLGARPEYAEATAREIDCEIRKLIDQAHEDVRTILAARRDALIHLHDLLMEHEVIEGERLAAFLEEHGLNRPYEPSVERRPRGREASSPEAEPIATPPVQEHPEPGSPAPAQEEAPAAETSD